MERCFVSDENKVRSAVSYAKDFFRNSSYAVATLRSLKEKFKEVTHYVNYVLTGEKATGLQHYLTEKGFTSGKDLDVFLRDPDIKKQFFKVANLEADGKGEKLGFSSEAAWTEKQAATIIEADLNPSDPVLQQQKATVLQERQQAEVLNAAYVEAMQQRYPDVSPEVFTRVTKVFDDFSFALAAEEWGSKQSIIREAQAEGRELTETEQKLLQNIEEEFAAKRQAPYIPYNRYGKYKLSLFDREGTKFFVQHFKTQDEAILAYKAILADPVTEQNGITVRGGVVPEDVKFYAGMSLTMIRDAVTKLQAQKVPPQIIENVRDLLLNASSVQGFAAHYKRRFGYAGYDENVQRSYDMYMLHYPKHLAKAVYGNELARHISNLERDPTYQKTPEDAMEIQRLVAWMNKDLSYFMSPGKNYSFLRATGFMWFMGLNPSSLLIQPAQIFMFGAPHLAAKFSGTKYMPGRADAEVMAEITKAMMELRSLKSFEQNLTADERLMFTALDNRGGTTFGQQTEAAGQEHLSGLARAMRHVDWKENPEQAFKNLFNLSLGTFSRLETYSRRVVALAGYRMLAKRKLAEGVDVTKDQKAHDLLVEETMEDVYKSMFDMRSIAQPALTRGGLGVVLMFKNYLINSLHFYWQNPGSARALALLVGMAGISGLPGAEDAMDIAESIFQQFHPNEKIDLRQDMHHALKYVIDHPEEVMHGITGLGPRFSLGRIVPGVSSLTTRENAMDKTGGFMREALGPFGSMLESTIKALDNENPTPVHWKVASQALPGIFRNGWQAAMWHSAGVEFDNSGNPVYVDGKKIEHDEADVILKLAGFTRQKYQVGMERKAMLNETLRFYKARQHLLLKELGATLNNSDRNLFDNALNMVKEYNKEVLSRPETRLLAIKSDEIRKTLVAYNRKWEGIKRPAVRALEEAQR